jgi:hypothetical protein
VGGHVVEIDVAASGFAYVKPTATASAGPVVIGSKNPQSVRHDISHKGNGVDLHGKVVSNGGESLITIADLKLAPTRTTARCPGTKLPA